MNSPEILVRNYRGELVDEEHCGYLIYANSFDVKEIIGQDDNYPYFLRSCAKPLQASLIVDYNLDKSFDLTEEEIAICIASHAGEIVHENLVKSILEKIGLNESYLKCGIHSPLSKTRWRQMLAEGLVPGQVHNNCSGKHAMMLALCVQNGWDLKTYDDINHPLQQKIMLKVNELCEVSNKYPIAKDGCGVPIFSMPLKNMLKGYLNLFLHSKYSLITNVMLNHPYLIGGEDRTDTKVIEHSKNIVCKTGAGGLFIVVDVEHKDGFIVKISDCDMKAREAVVAGYLKKLNRANIPFDWDVKNGHGEIIGKIRTVFDKNF